MGTQRWGRCEVLCDGLVWSHEQHSAFFGVGVQVEQPEDLGDVNGLGEVVLGACGAQHFYLPGAGVGAEDDHGDGGAVRESAQRTQDVDAVEVR